MVTRRAILRGAACGGLFSWHGLSQEPAIGADHRFEPDVEIKLVAEPGMAEIWVGKPTPVLQFRGEVVGGRADALRESGSFLGPTFDLVRGERVRVHFENRLAEPTIVHWHGMIVPEKADGHPRLAIKSGQSYTYEFQVTNRAGTYWYHPHPHGRTGYQVYYGLGGALLVRDPTEEPIGLPAGTDEHLLVIQDRRADQNNRLQYMSHMMDRMMGALGDQVLVNGKANNTLTVSRRPNRLRLLNLSNARLYKLAWSDGSPMHVIATDGGLLSGDEGPRQVPFVVLGPAERVELWEDFSTRDARAQVTLVSQEFSLPMGMMGRGMMGRGMMGRGMMGRGMMGRGMMRGPGEKLSVAQFQIADQAAAPGVLPTLPGRRSAQWKAYGEVETRLGFRAMQGFLNGKRWNASNAAHVDRDEVLKHNAPVIWTFDNASEPRMLMPHPMHLHGVQFRILERKGNGAGELMEGIIDAGDQDTVMVYAGEKVKILVKPTVPGLFLYHCHNLEHEDGGMMRNFRVVA